MQRERLRRQLFPDVEQLNTIEKIDENPIEREGSEQSEDEENYSEHDTNSEVSLDDLAEHEEDFNVQDHECHDCLCYYGKGSSNCVANQNQPVQWSKKISVKLEGVFFVQEPKTESRTRCPQCQRFICREHTSFACVTCAAAEGDVSDTDDDE
ncbi:hypothetical protein J6590_049922 [Homalodisca vitripennis]|nr:hypothetical protein J6590_049922 [Homalodisca vitripennis]